HTRSKRDWSSDVCSSDLLGEELVDHGLVFPGHAESTEPVGVVHPGQPRVETSAPELWLRHGRRVVSCEKVGDPLPQRGNVLLIRSEERRVGKERRCGCSR